MCTYSVYLHIKITYLQIFILFSRICTLDGNWKGSEVKGAMKMYTREVTVSTINNNKKQ